MRGSVKKSQLFGKSRASVVLTTFPCSKICLIYMCAALKSRNFVWTPMHSAWSHPLHFHAWFSEEISTFRKKSCECGFDDFSLLQNMFNLHVCCPQIPQFRVDTNAQCLVASFAFPCVVQ